VGKRLLPVVLIVLLLVMQAQLWFGRGSLTHVSELRAELERQKASNDDARRKIDQLSAEVNDLKEGLNMVEERARSELGMVKPHEILVQLAK
jgi:cell division protein FtsB